MFTVLLWVFLLALVGVGLTIYFTRPKLFSWGSAGTFAVCVLSVALIAPLSFNIAQDQSHADAVGGYHQFLNGSIVSTNSYVTTCEEDGDCVHTYDCDPYTVIDQVAYTDSQGNYHPEVSHTAYHSCPHVTQEFTYQATDSLGRKHNIAYHIFSDHPKKWRGENIPSNVARGVPMLWQTMTNDVARGNLYPITLPSTYDNYILADQHTILREHSDDIKQLTKLKLLPEHTQNLRHPIYDGFSADKVSFVGFQPSNALQWQRTLMYFNAALGMTLQGDLHVVAIKSSAIPSNIDHHNYLLALKAYWLNDFGKYALPKNGIILVLGVDDAGTTVQWSEASTGMPVGNGAMLTALSQLGNTPFSIPALFGNTTARVVTDKGKAKAAYTVGSGQVPHIIMQQFAFARACMKCTSKADKAKRGQGFTYLSTELPVPTSYIVWTVVFNALIMALLYGGLIGYLLYSNEHDKPGADNPFSPNTRRLRINGSWPFTRV